MLLPVCHWGGAACRTVASSSASNYDGATYGKRAGFGGAGTVGILSLWGKTLGADNDGLLFHRNAVASPVFQGFDLSVVGGAPRVSIFDATTGSLLVIDLDFNSAGSPGNWSHFLAVWDSQDFSRNKAFLNGSDSTSDSSVIPNQGKTLAYGTTDSFFAARRFPPDPPTSILGGPSCVAQFYLRFNEYLDPAQPGVIEKFYCHGRPAEIGADGSLPTGTRPEVYLPAGDFTDNKGTAGNWSLEAGGLTACADAP